MVARLSDISRDLHSRVRRFFDARLDADAAPIEICQAVLDEIETKVQPVGRGRRVFPYTRLIIHIQQRGGDSAPMEAAFHGFEARVKERLAELTCEVPATLGVEVRTVSEAPDDWPPGQIFALDLVKDPPSAPALPAPSPVACLKVVVLKGAATEEVYTFTEEAISIGRTADPTDEFGRIRRNRVAFLDIVDGVTETVGRAHARLRFDAATGECLVFDEGSSNGTAVIRNGAAIRVPARDPRGVRVRSGDEVQVGRAVMRVMIEQSEIADSLIGE